MRTSGSRPWPIRRWKRGCDTQLFGVLEDGTLELWSVPMEGAQRSLLGNSSKLMLPFQTPKSTAVKSSPL